MVIFEEKTQIKTVSITLTNLKTLNPMEIKGKNIEIEGNF